MSTIETTAYTDAEVIAAIRLALTGAGDGGVLANVVRELVERAPESDSKDTRSVSLFIDAVRSVGGEFVVNG